MGNLLDKYLETKPKCKTPLCYMGGKTKAIKIILSYIPENIDILVSPFIGGGSIEVACASLGIEVYGYDVYRPLISFWKQILYHPKRLSKEIIKHRPVTRETYKSLLKKIDGGARSELEEAAAYVALNKSSFMAQVGAGISTNIKNNISDGLIKRISEFYCPTLEVELMSFRDSIPKNKKFFMYLDPPYYVAARHDRYYAAGNFHEEEHIDLYHLLKQVDRWVLSYDNVPEVREMYKDYKQIPLQWTYSNATGSYTPKEPKELIILGKGNECI